MQIRAILNPEAPPFVPATQSSSQRKAPSSATAGKSTNKDTENASDGKPATLQNPVIQSKEIFAGLLPASRDGQQVKVLDPAAGFLPQDRPRAINSRSSREAQFLESRRQTERLRDAGDAAMADSGSSSLESENRSRAEPWPATGAALPTKPREVILPRVTAAVIAQACTNSQHRAGGATSDAGVKFLPLGPINNALPPSSQSLLEILPESRRYVDQNITYYMPENVTYPSSCLPMEMFEHITSKLARSDIKNMRIVNKEFERNVSSSFFKTATVPFNTELYDMVEERTGDSVRQSAAVDKGKGKARDGDARLLWKNAADDRQGKVYNGHGLRVFEGFGPHIRRFGISFEVSEDQLALPSLPPEKRELDQVHSYHGEYPWPPQGYRRFAQLVGLEREADETSRMVAAMSKLDNVHELGLSIDNGLGRLTGSDRSIRNIVFDRSPTIFDDSANPVKLDRAQRFWQALEESATSLVRQSGNAFSYYPSVNLREQRLFRTGIEGGINTVSGLRDSIYSDPQTWPGLDSSSLLSRTKLPGVEDPGLSVFFLTGSDHYDGLTPKSVNPALLRKEQQEWLLEVSWAQRAFLESYMLAVVSNADVFAHVKTLKIAKISSSLLATLDRPDFWRALPNVSDVTIMVNPDWRTVQRDAAGCVETPHESPSKAVDHFYGFLQQIADTPTIKKLRIGYTDGGEHAQGLHGRNCNVLPAPLFPLLQCLIGTPVDPLLFRNIWEITLVNCWLTPQVLRSFLRAHADFALGTVILDSVSLTADPTVPPSDAQAPPQVGLQQVNPQMYQQMYQQGWGGLGNGNAGAWAGPPAPVVLPQQAGGHWTTGHRPASWPMVIDSISPGPRLEEYGEQLTPWEEQLPPRQASNLSKIVFKSCGYVKLTNNVSFDQSVLDDGSNASRRPLSPWMRTRYAALLPEMMSSNDGMLARIHSYIPLREMNALRFAWGMREGWEHQELALDATFDGHYKGGTGRFSGEVKGDMGLHM